MMSKFMLSTSRTKAGKSVKHSRSLTCSFVRVASCLSPLLYTHNYGMAFLHNPDIGNVKPSSSLYHTNNFGIDNGKIATD